MLKANNQCPACDSFSENCICTKEAFYAQITTFTARNAELEDARIEAVAEASRSLGELDTLRSAYESVQREAMALAAREKELKAALITIAERGCDATTDELCPDTMPIAFWCRGCLANAAVIKSKQEAASDG